MCISALEFVRTGADYCPYCQGAFAPAELDPEWDEPEAVHVRFRCRVCYARWAIAFVVTGDLRTLQVPDPPSRRE